MNLAFNITLWTVYLLSLYFAVFWFLVFLDKGISKNKTYRIKKWPVISIAVPAYNEEDCIKETIESVLELNYPKKKLDIMVINDGSTDRTEEIAKEVIKRNRDFSIRLINQKNSGKGASLNKALDLAKGSYFICLDADSSVERNALRKMLPYFSKKNIVAVLPVMKVKQPENFLQKVQWYEYIVNMFYKRLMSKLNCVHVAPGPFSIYRKDVLKKVGGFDEHNLTEDLEMTLRLQQHNYEIIQLLNTEAYTIAPRTLKELYKQRNRWFKGSVINALRYRHMVFNKKYGDFGMMQMPTIIISGVLALVIIISALYYFFKYNIFFVKNFIHINFDVMTLIRNFRFDFNILDLNFAIVFTAILMFVITVIIFRKAHKHTREGIAAQGVMPLLFFFFLYYLLMGIMWIGISLDLLFRRKHRW